MCFHEQGLGGRAKMADSMKRTYCKIYSPFNVEPAYANLPDRDCG